MKSSILVTFTVLALSGSALAESLKSRVVELEARAAELEAQVQALEARPVLSPIMVVDAEGTLIGPSLSPINGGILLLDDTIYPVTEAGFNLRRDSPSVAGDGATGSSHPIWCRGRSTTPEGSARSRGCQGAGLGRRLGRGPGPATPVGTSGNLYIGVDPVSWIPHHLGVSRSELDAARLVGMPEETYSRCQVREIAAYAERLAAEARGGRAA